MAEGTPDAATAPRIVHAVRGRTRVHLPRWSGADPRRLEEGVTRLPGVEGASASARTQNVLVRFDDSTTDVGEIVGALAWLAGDDDVVDEEAPLVVTERGLRVASSSTEAGRQRARIAVRGLDRDPELARILVERLESRPDVHRARASVLTGRVLVELDEQAELASVLAEISELEPPAVDSEEIPSHPLDPAPLIEGSTRLIGAVMGLGLIGARRMRGAPSAPISRAGPAEVAGTLSILEGLPSVTERIEHQLGHDSKEMLFGALGVVSLTFSGSALGLAVAGAAGLRMFTEAHAKRSAWREYEGRLAEQPAVHPGARLSLRAGDRAPLPAEVLEGRGTAIAADGLPHALAPGAKADAGARLFGGPFTVRLEANGSFQPTPRPPPPEGPLDRYLSLIAPVSLLYAGVTGLATRSLARAFTALLLVNPRPALTATEAADRGASARAMRSGLTVVGSRAHRPIRKTDVIVVHPPRALADGLELRTAVSLGNLEASGITMRAAAVSAAAGSPWGNAFPPPGRVESAQGEFDAGTASAVVEGERWTLGPAGDRELPAQPEPDDVTLLLSRGDEPVGLVALRPRLAPGLEELRDTAARYRVRIEAVGAESPGVRRLAERAGVSIVAGKAAERVRTLQKDGRLVAVLSDSAEAAPAFDACDLAVGLTSGRSGRFHARADVLAPDLGAVAALVEAGVRRDAAVRDSVWMSSAANAAGAAWGIGGAPTFNRGARATNIGALAAMASGAWRLHGGRKPRSVVERLSDPQPERWGRQDVEAVLRLLETTPAGLSWEEAAQRRRPVIENGEGHPLMTAVVDQLRSPLITVLVAGAGLSLAMGAIADVVMIGAVIAANAAVGTWQERQAGQAAEALRRMSAQRAQVLRDGRKVELPAEEIVPGDVLLLANGDRIAADARVIEADRLEVDEAALTGESLPVAKSAHNGADESRVVLAGSDVTVGTGRAVVVAVGEETRMGAVSAALEETQERENPLDARLSQIMRTGFPVILIGGALVAASGLVRGQPMLPQLALGASIAIAAVPEGLPLLAGVAEAGVAQRLATRRALVSRLSSVETLGRVDVACTDKTGTMTEGRLAVTEVVDPDGRRESPPEVSPAFRDVLLTAALASPHPDAPNAEAHPTDIAVLEAADRSGLEGRIRVKRRSESPFDPEQGFHAAIADGRMRLKGAAETLAGRCTKARRGERDRPLDEAGRRGLLDEAERLAARGLRVLMVAQGPKSGSSEDPRGLTALGFLGISDPLRATVPAAVERCHAAGVRVVMLTGDHPATAEAIAREAGLPNGPEAILTGAEVNQLGDRELAERLERASVIARITPLDKVRIVESLQRRGHVVAMTGDGVNDAPALRLADVGVAMGRGGTDVARQASEVIVTDDDFGTLVEALVEGRGFWHNMRRALGLLLGGNLGELGLMVAAGIVGLPTPLTTRQILTVNLVTDVLPAVAIAVQEPEHRDLSRLAREGAAGLDRPLRNDVLWRGIATAAPSFGAYLLAARLASPARAQAVAFGSIVGTQLSQTIDLGRTEGRLTGAVGGAAAASAALVAACLSLPPLQRFLGLAMPTPVGGLLIGGASGGAVVVSRALRVANGV
jgi:cation-transporting ATPase I